MARKKGTYTKQTADPDLLQHIQLLGLETVKEYRQWCVQNGFQNHIRKRRLRRRQECFHYREMLAESRLKQKKRERSSIVEKLSVVCSENVNHDSLTDPLLKRIERVYRVNKHCLDRSDVIRNAFLQLVSHIHCRQAKFFIHSSANHDWDYSQEQRYLKALVFIASEARSWIRPIKAWRPVGSNARRQFSSLLRHLFVEYQMPLFFDSVWLNNWAPVCYNWREWYLDVGRGQNICHCRLPIPYTKKMAHHFMRAPQDLTFLQALRWGQILGMGGDARLARSILASRIGVGFPRDEFWSTAIQWLIHHPGLDRTQIGLFVDYFIIQRYGVSPDEFDEDSMPVNSYSLKGRTFSSLLRDVTEWHREKKNKNRAPDYEWE
ncbi:MAG: hypothetical protein KDA77_21835, partial [Planctomycetaceae bacterium]|nr:hypothetical protein [Planctomycetaceae bacterium]